MIEHIFSKDGEIAKLLSDYEEREPQIVMAKAVEKAINESNYLICEAGTGIGKSFSYLVPFIKWAVRNSDAGNSSKLPPKKRVLISTYTKTLQNQLLTKDIPILQSALGGLGLKFTASAAFGSENYLCLRRWHKLTGKGELFQNEDLERIAEWEAHTQTGLRSELERDGIIKIFSDVARTPDLCLGKKCKFKNDCYYEQAKRKLFKSDVIVVNHWLFFTNIISGKRVLPKYDAVVFDEAQALEEVATLYFGIHISNYTIDFFLNALKRDIGERNLNQAITETHEAKKDFFKKVLETAGNEKVVRIREKGIMPNLISPELNAISQILKNLRKNAKGEEEAEEIRKYMLKCKDMDVELGNFLNQSDSESVYWIEITRRTSRSRDLSHTPTLTTHDLRSRISLNSAPIHIAPWMEQYVFDSDIPIVLTSATLTVDRSFDFFTERIGLQDKEELLLSTSFDYKENAILYVPRNGPEPRTNGYSKFVASEIEKLVEATLPSSGVLILFTSFKLMNEVYKLVEARLHRSHLKQGEASRDELLERFKGTPSVLFGVQSFWQGVDVPGEALSMVIITRLPFEVPDSPIAEARAEWVAASKGNPFWEYQLPQAVMQLKQGFGRLIRRCTDSGVVAILDTRIRRRAYGKKFLSSLPECEITYNIEKVKHFFASQRKQ